MALPSTFSLLIAGKVVPGAVGTYDVINPATGGVLAQAAQADQAQVDAAVDAAYEAFPAWGAPANLPARQEAARRAAAALAEHEMVLARLLTSEQGKPIHMAIGEVKWATNIFLESANLVPPVEVYSETEKWRVEVRRKPIGVVAGITPWNFPVLTFIAKFAPAVVLGNPFVVKPSPFTPLTTLYIGEILKDVFPPGVFNVVSGSDQAPFNVGAYLTKHPKVSKVSFTGSIATGKKIFHGAADDIKRITLELGGNDAAILLEDCNVDEVAPRVFANAMFNSGQTCVAIKRVFVHDKIYDKFVQKLAECARQAKLGEGFEAGVQYGPLNNKMQFDRVKELVEDAKHHGANILTGGAPLDRPGYFYPPTVISDVAEGVRIVDEEQFGPVIPVIRYHDVEDAIHRANNTQYGLGGSVWSSNTERANELVDRIAAGTVWVNDHIAATGAPFGGFKHSGLGREMGKEDITAYTEIQTVRLAK
jgi:acyl-CoA reductase-like NAD-dependent aldehyde dehydrogenase